MNRYPHGMAALGSMLHQHLTNVAKPQPMAALQALAKRNGFTASDARYQLHRMAMAGEVEYTADPTTVSVMATGVEV
ncbi:hypothetical protein [Vreelandella alkaliphila]|uniref:hypothetical protein n=1 Tax=Vreelandella alkaliphila TaxID=272774 RepID=UPI003FD6E4B5